MKITTAEKRHVFKTLAGIAIVLIGIWLPGYLVFGLVGFESLNKAKHEWYTFPAILTGAFIVAGFIVQGLYLIASSIIELWDSRRS